jgi:hypothetical protein
LIFVYLEASLYWLYALVDYARNEVTDFTAEITIAVITQRIELFIELLGYKFDVKNGPTNIVSQNKIIQLKRAFSV